MSVTVSLPDKQINSGHLTYIPIQRQEYKARLQDQVKHTSQGQKEVKNTAVIGHGEILGLGVGRGGKSVKLLFPGFQQVRQTQRAPCAGVQFSKIQGAETTHRRCCESYRKPRHWPRTSCYLQSKPPDHTRQTVSKIYSSSPWSTVVIIKSKILYTCDVWRVFFF